MCVCAVSVCVEGMSVKALERRQGTQPRGDREPAEEKTNAKVEERRKKDERR